MTKVKTALWIALPAVLIAIAAVAPFHDKAFTVDDTLFLRQAEHLLHDPLHPTAFEMVWSELPWPTRMSAIMPSGPVMAYLLVPCVRAGGLEWIGHVTQLLLFVLGICATASLAGRLGLEPRLARLASLLLVATPTALAMAATCMPDIPAMTFGVTGVERLVAWHHPVCPGSDDARLAAYETQVPAIWAEADRLVGHETGVR